MHQSEAEICSKCRNCTDVTRSVGVTKAARGHSARKCIDPKKKKSCGRTQRGVIPVIVPLKDKRVMMENHIHIPLLIPIPIPIPFLIPIPSLTPYAQSLPSVVCIEGNKSVFAAMVGRVVKQTIFPKKQFIILDRELDENSKLADSCVKALNLERTKWYSVRNLVRVRLNRVRNNAQQNVRKKLLSKW